MRRSRQLLSWVSAVEGAVKKRAQEVLPRDPRLSPQRHGCPRSVGLVLYAGAGSSHPW